MLNAKTLLIMAALLAALFYWQSHKSQPVAASASTIDLSTIADGPLQIDSNAAAFALNGFQLQPLAEFSIRARVLSSHEYSSGIEAKLSPLDLALGWDRMADPLVYQKLNITQSGRWYRYSWSDQPPIPSDEIIRSSANMHMIPANDEIANILLRAETGNTVTLKGKLVEISGDNQWKWRSSTTRTDSGQGACEVIYVEAAAVN